MQDTPLHAKFGKSAEIPAALSQLLKSHKVEAFQDSDYLVLNFPEIRTNPELTTIYDQIQYMFPTAFAMRTADDERIVKIPAGDLEAAL